MSTPQPQRPRQRSVAHLALSRGEGGGTDAAFAALNSLAAILERMGLLGFGEHSDNAEYVLIDSIAPRLYFATRLIMDISLGKALPFP